MKPALVVLVSALLNCVAMASPSKILVHGHRGSRGTHPENTILAFQEAVEAGSDVIELDMQLTKDGVVIISHEPEITGHLCRGKDGKPVEKPVPIRTVTAQELKEFDCGSVKNPRFPEQIMIPGTRIPTLDEFLVWKKNAAPNLDMNIETKMTAENPKNVADPAVFAKAVVTTLKKHGALKEAILQSFDFRTLVAARRLEPSLRISALFDEGEKDICTRTKQLGAPIISPHFSHLSPQMVEECRKAGLQIVPWTLNRPEEWTIARTLGVDAIITDYPRKLIAFLHAQPG